jgi:hypothetical protein
LVRLSQQGNTKRRDVATPVVRDAMTGTETPT